ncbi:hypothetical protein MKJ04_02160 [Pontibacter sp. E15-1]|uniref:fibronectin type III domain-containing protein n=1 Tax=Pontibacter sp. E15-1 TaxID=2919918 RepID=UPI001F4FA2C3|nr:hypothetical protein [Pontibacter sp. E15-1]MCJ8163627.1 hypothetical protein [Pontibacter sp. E15-1]
MKHTLRIWAVLLLCAGITICSGMPGGNNTEAVRTSDTGSFSFPATLVQPAAVAQNGMLPGFTPAAYTRACIPAKLSITPAMLTNESGKGDAAMLLDEQSLAGFPDKGQGGAPATAWFPGWNAADYPASVYLDLGEVATITAIFIRDINDTGIFTVEAGSPGNWVPLLADNLTGYQSWNQHNVNVDTRYLRFTRQSQGSNVSEIVLYGCVGTATPDTMPPARITSIRAVDKSSSSVDLSWIATGNDGKTGTAAGYDLRMSTSPLTSNTALSNAVKLNGIPTPAVSGTTQGHRVTGLSPATTYYFALKASDSAGNSSLLSNSVAVTTDVQTTPTQSRITVDQFIGINAFVDDPLDKLQVAGFVREYHNWNWDEGNIWSGGGNTNYPRYPNNQMKWSPSEPGFDFDAFYTRLGKANIGISPVIQGSVAWLHGGRDFPFANKPVDEPGASTTNPNSYEKKAHHMFQFAARYGNTRVADSKLTLAPGQSRETGMGLVHYMEDWNEQDNNWNGPDAHFSPEEYAAMASADYDGHGGTMKQGSGTFGVKNADPTMKLVMGGIFELNLEYVKRMKSWFETNRADKKFAADVINVHTYAWRTANGPGGGGPAKSPEEDKFREKLQAFVAYRNHNLPNVEVWISEFGWDTHPASSLRVPEVGPFDRQEVQGQWLVRAYLAFAAAGVDRAMMYMLRDVNPNDPTHFSTSGLVGPKGSWEPKKSWYYVYTLKNTLQHMAFVGEQASGDPNVLIYKFKNTSGSNGAYVVWAKTKRNYTVQGYALSLAGSPSSATKVQMVPGDTDGVSSVLPISGNKVKLDVSERPVFIKVDKMN